MNWLRKLWRGVYPLHVAFWIFYVIGYFVAMIVGGLLLFFLTPYGLRPIGFILGLFLALAYMLIATVGVWQSAGVRMKSPIWMDRVWAAAARAIVGLYAMLFIVGMINGGAVALMARLTGRLELQ
jgi:hypothetical protein